MPQSRGSQEQKGMQSGDAQQVSQKSELERGYTMHLDGAFLGDIQALKDAAHEDLGSKKYDVTDFYHEKGCFQAIAKNKTFDSVTLGVISINALWMGIDTDLNDAETLADAEIQFRLAEQFFALFFTSELFIRFMAFKRKRDCVKDGWFKFDSILCGLMVFETWILPSMAGDGGRLPVDTSMLRLLRLLRLSRMVRLLRKCPELLTLLKGMVAAVRSVFSTLVLLVVFMYIFAIIFRQQTKGNEELADYFGSMGLCFWTLLLQGTLLDDITDVLNDIKDDTPSLAALFLVFVLLGNFTVLNMLIGVLCEVVSGVADSEKEKMQVEFAKECFFEVLFEMDSDGSGTISQEEFETFLSHPQVVKGLQDLDVDRDSLISFSEVIFSKDEERQLEEEMHETVEGDPSSYSTRRTQSTVSHSHHLPGKCLDFGEILEAILNLRNSNTAMVKDVVDLRKFMMLSQKKMQKCITELTNQVQMQNANLQVITAPSNDGKTVSEKAASGINLATSSSDPNPQSNETVVENDRLDRHTMIPENFPIKRQVNAYVSSRGGLDATVEDIGARLDDICIRMKGLEQVNSAQVAVQQSASVPEKEQSIVTYFQGRLAEKDALMQQVLGLLNEVLRDREKGGINAISAEDPLVSQPEMLMDKPSKPAIGFDKPRSPEMVDTEMTLMKGGQLKPSKKPRLPAPSNSYQTQGLHQSFASSGVKGLDDMMGA